MYCFYPTSFFGLCEESACRGTLLFRLPFLSFVLHIGFYVLTTKANVECKTSSFWARTRALLYKAVSHLLFLHCLKDCYYGNNLILRCNVVADEAMFIFVHYSCFSHITLLSCSVKTLDIISVSLCFVLLY